MGTDFGIARSNGIVMTTHPKHSTKRSAQNVDGGDLAGTSCSAVPHSYTCQDESVRALAETVTMTVEQRSEGDQGTTGTIQDVDDYLDTLAASGTTHCLVVQGIAYCHRS